MEKASHIQGRFNVIKMCILFKMIDRGNTRPVSLSFEKVLLEAVAVMDNANPQPMVPATHTTAHLVPGYSTSDLAPCDAFGKQGRMAQTLGSLQSDSKSHNGDPERTGILLQLAQL